MKKGISILQSESGAMLILASLIVFVLIATFSASLITQMQSLGIEMTRNKNRTSALQAMQDFGLMAAKANDVFIQAGGACPGGYTRYPAGSQFCWNGAALPNANACVVAPNGAGTWCMNQEATGSILTRIELAPPTDNDRLEVYKEAAKVALMKALSEFSNLSQAQVAGPNPWDPALPAPAAMPSARIRNKCPGGGPDDPDYCKVCTDVGGYTVAGSNVSTCLTVTVCPLGAFGLCAAGDIYTEKIAILNR